MKVGSRPKRRGLTAVRGGLLNKLFEVIRMGIRAEAASGIIRGRVVAERSGERGVAGKVAEHPENVGRLGAVIDGRDGLGERLAGTFAGTGGLGKRESRAAGFERFERLLAAL